MSGKRLASQMITKEQDDWLQAERQRTMNSAASIIRKLLQEKADKEGKKR